ncbi:MAG: alcohol dehydrogenase catalytic domain-containing protein, partial [Proteobacteria bacterium]|nr:alcohol dehydrogenase catalytic domain-containing protein [Burkholderiales bacterium]
GETGAPADTALHGGAYVKGDRAYLPYSGGGFVILDISDLSRPMMVSDLPFSPPFASRIAVHTALPLTGRPLVVVNSEAIAERCDEPLQFAAIIDVGVETRPRLISLFPLPIPPEDAPYRSFADRPGRFGPHNQHQPQYQEILYQDENTVFITWFNAGLRVYDISIERQPREIGYFIPPDPVERRGPLPKTGLVVQSEDVVVDARGNVYLSDKNHGIYVLRFDRGSLSVVTTSTATATPAMQALVLQAFGAPLQLMEVPRPAVGPNDVLVKVGACGVGLTVVNLLATPGRVDRYPRIPGHEIAGEVVEIGSEVRTVAVGTRVTNHFYLTCGQCHNCRRGRETLCLATGGNIGQNRDGGYADYVSLPARNVVAIPDGVSDVDAAVASDAIATPFHACLKEAKLGPGDSVMVIGAAGGVGIHMIQMARLCGARVIAVDVGAAKLEFVRGVGADVILDASAGDLAAQVMAHTGGLGVDAVIDIVASRLTLGSALASLAIGGRLVIVGAQPPTVYQDDPSFLVDPIRFLHRGLEVHASRYVTLAEIERTLALVRDGRIRAIVTQVVGLAQVPALHEAIRRGETLGRVAMTRGARD